MKKYIIGKNESGQRADRFVSRVLTLASWGEVQKLFRKKVFKHNGSRSVKTNDFVYEGDVIEIFLGEESLRRLGAYEASSREASFREASAHAEDNPYGGIIRIYEDEDYFAVFKPAGMLVHSDSADSKDDLTSIVRRILPAGEDRFFAPAAASRLDRGTSGVVVFAKNYRSLKQMNEEMRAGRILRLYQCVVEGALSGSGEIELVLRKDKKRNIVTADSPACGSDASVAGARRYGAGEEKYAKTYYDSEILGDGKYSLVTATLETGRTHQIRVSLAKIGHPIVGDIKYGSAIKRSSPLLHCAAVELLGIRMETESADITGFIQQVSKTNQRQVRTIVDKIIDKTRINHE